MDATLSRIKYGEASRKRNIRSGIEYDHLFSKAPGEVYTIKQNATLEDTMAFIPKIIPKIAYQTELIANDRKGKTVYDSCRNIWHFVYDHIQYKKDEKGYEQVRSPRRTLVDRKGGVDCDCYSVFISCILTNLEIPHILRITKYKENHFQHIYPIVPYGNRYITMDCVTDRFNYEVPFSAKKDYNMDLQFLDGIPENNRKQVYDDGMAELGRLIKRKMAAKKQSAAAPSSSPEPSKKKKKGLFKKVVSKVASVGKKVAKVGKKALSVVNKVNPAMVLLRNGLLAALKLNILNVAKRLRWSYLSPEAASNAGILPDKLNRLVKVRQKIESIFEMAGGKPSNLKNAMLKGKGNHDKKIPLNGIYGSGLMGLEELNALSIYTPLEQLLGRDVYYSENIEGADGIDLVEGLGELGEPVTASTIAAAMGTLTAIAASLKEIGNIFNSKQESGADDFDEQTNEAAENNANAVVTQQTTTANTPIPNNSPVQNQSDTYTDTPAASSRITTNQDSSRENSSTESPTAEADTDVQVETSSGSSLPVKSVTTTNTDNTSDKKTDKNNKWVKPVAIGVGVLAIGVIGYHLFKGNKPKNKSSPHQSLSGIPKNRKKNYHRKTKKNKKVAVKLM